MFNVLTIKKQKAEIEQLQACEEIKLVAFLSRPDIRVEHRRVDCEVVVFHSSWKFQGRASSIIPAARQAIYAERKLLAAKAGGK